MTDEDFSLSDMLKQSDLVRKSADGNSLADIFDEIPVDLDLFITDKRYLGHPRLSDIQYDVVKHIERIYLPQTLAQLAETGIPSWQQPVEMKHLFSLMWGKAAGKAVVTRIAFLRIVYLLLCLKSPQRYFKSPENESIHLINVAPTARQAREIFFDPMRRMIRNTFLAKYAHTTNYDIKFDKGIAMISGNSEGESVEGYNPLISVIDEIDAFKSRDEARAAGRKDPANSLEKILENLQSSGSSRFPAVYKSVLISYPREHNSAIIRYTAKGVKAIEKAKKEGKISRQYVSGPHATWDVNPTRHKEEFVEDYEDDPLLAASKYECKPSFSMNTYFRNDAAIEAAFCATAEPIKIMDYHKVGNAWEPIYKFAPDFIPIKGAQYSMHGDLAKNGDRAGIAMSHVVKLEEYWEDTVKENGETVPFRQMRPILKTDFVIAYEANMSGNDPMEIQIRWARELAFQLIKMGFNIKRFTFDGYASEDSIQLLNERGIKSKRVSTDLSEIPWQTLRDVMYDGRLIAPKNQLLIEELKGLGRQPGGKIDHSASGSKDLVDALACSVLGAIQIGGQEWKSGERAYYGGKSFDMGDIRETEMVFQDFDPNMLQLNKEDYF